MNAFFRTFASDRGRQQNANRTVSRAPWQALALRHSARDGHTAMHTTLIGIYDNFAAASRAAAALMLEGFSQSEISVVGHEAAADGSARGELFAARFVFAGALGRGLAGAREDDFLSRLVESLARLGVPPRSAMRHAQSLAQTGALVAIRADVDRAAKGEGVLATFGAVARYVTGPVPFRRPAHDGRGAREMAA